MPLRLFALLAVLVSLAVESARAQVDLTGLWRPLARNEKVPDRSGWDPTPCRADQAR
ncbi:MAG: hypothetical protein HYU37_01780 [Acidobacteria bacterium]|nr:hypothetical protein [Acidobacteriota bacterium]